MFAWLEINTHIKQGKTLIAMWLLNPVQVKPCPTRPEDSAPEVDAGYRGQDKPWATKKHVEVKPWATNSMCMYSSQSLGSNSMYMYRSQALV